MDDNELLGKRAIANERYKSLAKTALSKLARKVVTNKGLVQPPEKINEAIDEAKAKVHSLLERGYTKGAELGQLFAISELEKFGVPPPEAPLGFEDDEHFTDVAEHIDNRFEVCREALLGYADPKKTINGLRLSVYAGVGKVVNHGFTRQQLNVYKLASFNKEVPKEYARPDRGKGFFFLLPVVTLALKAVTAFFTFGFKVIKTTLDILMEIIDRRPMKVWKTTGSSCLECHSVAGEQVDLWQSFSRQGPPAHPYCDCRVSLKFDGSRDALEVLKKATGFGNG